MAMESAACAQDHVILLLSTQDFENLPAWLSDNFNILEGGEHIGTFSMLLIKDNIDDH